mmetsp:Transcript_113017/g.300239  ORF Transcript_113017/g.300239 Transcript_113017/m.300239 type:complete len:211 (+) Transcript_113017:448-1080(+)
MRTWAHRAALATLTFATRIRRRRSTSSRRCRMASSTQRSGRWRRTSRRSRRSLRHSRRSCRSSTRRSPRRRTRGLPRSRTAASAWRRPCRPPRRRAARRSRRASCRRPARHAERGGGTGGQRLPPLAPSLGQHDGLFETRGFGLGVGRHHESLGASCFRLCAQGGLHALVMRARICPRSWQKRGRGVLVLLWPEPSEIGRAVAGGPPGPI